MDLHLKGKTVIITGGTKGIGSGISEAFAQEGANLIIDYRSNNNNSSEEFIEYLKKTYNVEAYGIKQDVSERGSAEKIMQFAMEKFGRLDILINNAGTTKRKDQMIWELDYDSWQNALDNNVTQFFMMSAAFSRIMIENQWKGAIVNVLSKASVSTTHKGRTCYVTNKTAELGLTRQLAVDLADKGIIVNGVMPGSVKNQRYEERSEEWINERIKRIPLGRYNEPIEIGRMVAFLASDANQVSIGAGVDVSGGMLLGF